MKKHLVFNKIAVVGAGAMGIGIAQVISQSGAKVFLFDISHENALSAKRKLGQTFERLVSKKKFKRDEADTILDRVVPVEKLSHAVDVDLVIEAVSENLEIKTKVFSNLEKIFTKSTIFATNTSSLSIGSLAKHLKNPQRLIGLHFFNPAPVMHLVEVIPSLATDEKLAQKCKKWLLEIGKAPVMAKDSPGFIVNRVVRSFYGEAMNIYEEGLASPETIDWAMTSIGKFRMGPFMLTDFIGQDVNYTVSESVWKQFYNEPRFRPNRCQKELVDLGWLGRKTGRGFYKYENGEAQVPNAKEDFALGEYILNRILATIINEALSALSSGICSREDLETSMVKGVNYPMGIIEWAEKLGPKNVLKLLQGLFQRTGDMRYRPAPLLQEWAESGGGLKLTL